MKHYVNSLAGHFSGLLAQREAELAATLRACSEEELTDAQTRNAEVQDFKDLADRESQSDMAVMDAARAMQELSQVLAARRRLQEGHYGRCAECGKPIDLRRLEAMPATPLCVVCQTADEEVRSAAQR